MNHGTKLAEVKADEGRMLLIDDTDAVLPLESPGEAFHRGCHRTGTRIRESRAMSTPLSV